MLVVAREQVIILTQEASKRGWLDFKGAGNVFEINFGEPAASYVARKHTCAEQFDQRPDKNAA